MFNFTPDDHQQEALQVPYIEDARADMARLYSSDKTINQAKSEIEINLARLGAALVSLQSGTFNVNGQDRIGYVLRFRWHGAEGNFPIAGLPIRKRTEAKERQVRVQALLNIAAWLDTCWALQVFSPQSMPLIQYLLTGDGKRVIDHMLASGAVPMLSAPQDDVIDAEFEE